MSKVLYISYDGMTDPLGQSQVIPYLKEFSKHGYQLTILSFEKKDRFQKNEELIRSILAKAGIKWEPLPFSSQIPFFSKWYDIQQIRNATVALHKKNKFDLTHCRSYVAADAGLLLKSKYNVPFLFDMRGFWVDERVDNGQWNLSNPIYRFLYKTYKKKEKSFLEQSARIISLTNNGKEELVNSYGVDKRKITVIPCCVDLDHFNYKNIDAVKINSLKKQWGIDPTCKILSYLGSLGGWYLTEEMMDFFRQLKFKYPDAKFLFITQDDKQKIQQLAMTKALLPEDIIVQPASRSEVPLFLSLSNWSIFFIKDAYSKKASSPTKQGEIMAMGIPLICNDIGDTGKIVEESGTGLVLNNFAVSEYDRIINQMSELSNIGREKIREAAFQNYDLQKGSSDYIKVYKKILQRD
jgi:glycosyltransferase involved in cell wall biosynthesis